MINVYLDQYGRYWATKATGLGGSITYKFNQAFGIWEDKEVSRKTVVSKFKLVAKNVKFHK